MSAAPVLERRRAEQADDVVLQRLQETSAWLGGLIGDRDTAEPVSEAARIDRIAHIERLQATLEAAKLAEIVAFARGSCRRTPAIELARVVQVTATNPRASWPMDSSQPARTRLRRIAGCSG